MMGILNKKQTQRKRKPTTGFSELNRRTYEARTPSNNTPRQNSSNARKVNSPHNYQAQNHIPAGNINEYSRTAQSQKYSQKRKKQNKKSRRKKIIIIVASIIAFLLIAAGAAFAYFSCNLNSGMGDIGLTPTSLDKPFYMVLMGVDSSEERKSNGGTDEDYRSDSIILARIAADEKKVTLMSLHRDIEIDMGEYGTQKLNAAHSLGGPQLVIKTVSKLCGVDINHYAEINFDGFKAAVDDLGGVEVNVPMEINDAMAGGHVPEGVNTLNGEQALILCRARHAYDNFGDGDKFRAANQRMVLSAIAQKALSSDILTIAKTATDLSKYIKTDLALNDMIGLAQLMKGLDPNKDVYSAMTPTEGVYTDGVWYEVLDKEEFALMMARMDKGLPPNEETIIDPETGTIMSTAGGGSGEFNGTVSVLNGTDITGLASKVSGILTTMGFKAEADNADSSDYTKTLIIYNNEDNYDNAEAISDRLGCGRVVENDGSYSNVTDYIVILGTDYGSLN